MKTTLTNVRHSLEKARLAYDKRLDKILAKARESLIIPFCDKHKCMLSAGMGSWSFHFRNGDMWAWSHSEPQETVEGWDEICELMLTESLYETSFGALMEDYTPKNY